VPHTFPVATGAGANASPADESPEGVGSSDDNILIDGPPRSIGTSSSGCSNTGSGSGIAGGGACGSGAAGVGAAFGA